VGHRAVEDEYDGGRVVDVAREVHYIQLFEHLQKNGYVGFDVVVQLDDLPGMGIIVLQTLQYACHPTHLPAC
jgi:hypothetical protein